MTEPQPPRDDGKALEQVLTFLGAKDDTSRFVGLSLLRTVLDSDEALRNDEGTVKQCWAAVPNKFLIRLLRPGSEDDDETKNMNNLAVAVIHTFVNLLPNDPVSGDKKLLELIPPLVKILNTLNAATKMLAFQTLQVLVSSPSGAHVFARIENGLPISASTEQDASLREWLKLYDIAMNAAHDKDLQDFLTRFLVEQLQAYEEKGLLLQVLGSIDSRLRILRLPGLAKQIVHLIHNTVMKRPTPQARTSAIFLASSIIQNFAPGSWPPESLFSGPPGENVEDKPFAYVFTQYILIDLRSTIPTLMPALASPTYQTTALRLAACYDVITGFISYLISLIYSKSSTRKSIPSELLLKLRRDVSETFSLTLEFFRDRWDAVTTGASGLDPSARLDPKAPSMLTWDNPLVSPEEDPIILSGLRALSLWLREDDNEDLSMQALGVMDMLGALYEASTKVGAIADFRPPIRSLLQTLLQDSTPAVNIVLENSGWELLARDLESNIVSQTWSAVRDIIRVLLAIVDSDAVPQSREKWIHVVRLAANMNAKEKCMEQLETLAEMFHLAIAIYEKAPSRLQKMVQGDENKIRDKARAMTKQLKRRSGIEEGLVDSFAEIGLIEV